jgi:hypothetical protein
MLASPEILDAIHAVEVRLMEERRRAGRVPRRVAVEVGASEVRRLLTPREPTPLDLVADLTRQLATLWGQYREVKRA